MDAGGIGPGVDGERTGARTLGLLASPLNTLILDKLAQGSRRLVELRRETGSPPQTTLRSHLKELSEIGAVARRRLHPFPGVREYVLTNRAGGDLRFVAAILEAWLAESPSGRLPLGSDGARAAVKALVEGWSSTVVHAVAARPVSLAELDSSIGSLSHQSLERRLRAMHLVGLVRSDGVERGAPFVGSEWLRRGIAPLTAAIRWERNHMAPVTAPPMPLDAEAGFLLVVPLLELPREMKGSCLMGVEFADGRERRLVGVTVDVEEGRVTSCTTRLDRDSEAWVTGPPAAWLRVAIEANPNRLEVGGKERLVHALLDALNRALFPPRLI